MILNQSEVITTAEHKTEECKKICLRFENNNRWKEQPHTII